MRLFPARRNLYQPSLRRAGSRLPHPSACALRRVRRGGV